MFLLKDLIKDVDYTVLSGSTEKEVSEIISDSRKAEKGSVFIALRGQASDGHSFLLDVVKKGCDCLVIEDLPDGFMSLVSDLPSVTVIRTQNTRKALALMAINRYGDPLKKLRITGITGTKGKTTTAHMLKRILDMSGRKCAIIGTTGIHYGDKHIETKNTTPDALILQKAFSDMVNDSCTDVVMEVSSQAFKLYRVYGICFDTGIFTNIEPDHIGPGEHESFEEYLECKSRIFENSRFGLVNADDMHSAEIIKRAKCPIQKISVMGKGDIIASNIEPVLEGNSGSRFKIMFNDFTDEEMMIPLPGLYNVYNALMAAAAAKHYGISEDTVKLALKDIFVDGRTEVAFRNEKMTVVVDYAHNEMAMKNLLEALRPYTKGRLVTVFGCGGNRSKDRRYGMGRVSGRLADLSILTADNSRYEETSDIISDIKSALIPEGGKFIEIEDRREAIRYAMKNAQPGDLIAVIGKGHEDYQEVKGVRTHFLDREVIEEMGREILGETCMQI